MRLATIPVACCLAMRAIEERWQCQCGFSGKLEVKHTEARRDCASMAMVVVTSIGDRQEASLGRFGIAF